MSSALNRLTWARTLRFTVTPSRDELQEPALPVQTDQHSVPRSSGRKYTADSETEAPSLSFANAICDHLLDPDRLRRGRGTKGGETNRPGLRARGARRRRRG